MPFDFSDLNNRLLGQCPDLLRLWLPGGAKRGREYVCAGLQGHRGESCSINMQTGAWADFATGAKGGDLVSLYAAINNLTQGNAYLKLGGDPSPRAPLSVVPLTAPVPNKFGPPPDGAVPPTDGAENVWHYRDAGGALLFAVSRYPGKQIRPWSWDTAQRKWVQRAWPAPRPLYGLELLAERPEAAVLVVEGEKACDAARELAPNYVCVTWPNGAAAVGSADWSSLTGRRVLIWPDADQPGLVARDAIIDALRGIASEIKYLHVDDLPSGFDAADLSTDTDWYAWAKPRVVISTQPVALAPAEAQVTLVEDHAPLPESVAIICETYGLAVKGRSGLPLVNIENIVRVLSVIPGFGGYIWYDEFYESIRTDLPAGWVGTAVRAPGQSVRTAGRDWTDADTLALTMRLQRHLGFQAVSTSIVLEAITLAAHSDRRCAPRDWMSGLTWDGVARLGTWMPSCLGVAVTPYSKAIGVNFFVSMVARTFKPGCQVDNMVVLEGLQGAGKSSLFNMIAGEGWYAEATESPNSKDFFQALRGKILVEVAELDAFARTEVTRIKQLLSCRSDRYRESYGRLSVDHPRRSVFVGTTNESHYLRDSTGARRFWPIEAKRVDLAWMSANREQLFAEAVALYQGGAPWWEVPVAEARLHAEDRRIVDEWEYIIETYIEGREWVGTLDIWNDGFGNPAKDLDRMSQFRIANAMRALGWRNIAKRLDGKVKRVWVPPKTSGD